MKKHRWFAVISAMVMALAFAGCQINSDNHEHSFSKDWTSDATDHWHAATCEHTKEVSDKAAHTFGEWKTSVEATEETEGKKERVCSVCSYKEETNIAKLGHTHKFSENWTSDSIYHWHVAICGHAEEVSGKAAHTFGDYVSNNDATTESDGTKTRKCSVCGYEDTVTDEGSKIVATPIFSIESGAVDSGTSVTITCGTEGAKIYYTTDGTEPAASSTEYTAAISVTAAVTLKAIAVKDGMNNSAVASASYTIKGTVATPEFSVDSGAVNSGTEVTITCATEGAKIYYTTDGTEPTASSTEYTGAISITEAVTLKAIAVKDGMNDSAVASASYTIKPDYSKCAVGDFVLKDGTILSKDKTPESDTVAAVIVRAATNDKPALGVGIVHNRSGLAWCTTSAAGYNTNITALQGDKTSGYMDGSDGWEILKEACSEAENNPENYPAWNYSLTYAETNGLTGNLATGWYLPTVAELYTIYQNKTAVDASLSKAGGSQFGTSWYWSCCQGPSYNGDARGLFFYNGDMGDSLKGNNYRYVCSVRAFN